MSFVFTGQNNWSKVYYSWEKSGLSKKAFYNSKFNSMISGKKPALSTFYTHLRAVAQKSQQQLNKSVAPNIPVCNVVNATVAYNSNYKTAKTNSSSFKKGTIGIFTKITTCNFATKSTLSRFVNIVNAEDIDMSLLTGPPKN